LCQFPFKREKRLYMVTKESKETNMVTKETINIYERVKKDYKCVPVLKREKRL